jgi:chromosome segregation ATPase
MYGEFKTLAAQESDWMERLEKKLRKSTETAADAEEISEELDDIENFMNNHPEDRTLALEELATELKQRQILIGSLGKEAEKLRERWKELDGKAKKRTKTLEGRRKTLEGRRKLVFQRSCFPLVETESALDMIHY